MSLLFDQNLSHRLPSLITSDFPGSQQVRDHRLAAKDDQAIWDFALAKGLVIVTKDADFQHRALLYGPPPKVIWIRLGNNPTLVVVSLLRTRRADILAFMGDPIASFLVLP